MQADTEHQIQSAKSPKTRAPNCTLHHNIAKNGLLKIRERSTKWTIREGDFSEVRKEDQARVGDPPEVREGDPA